MLFKIGDDIFNAGGSSVLELLLFIDSKLDEISSLIKRSADPESYGYLDRGEYLMGAGFVLLQQYIITGLMNLEISKKKAFSLGPYLYDNCSVAEAINHAANYWKHESEWVGKLVSNRDTYKGVVNAAFGPFNKNPKNEEVGEEEDFEYLFMGDYPLSHILYKLNVNNDGRLSFEHVLSNVRDWEVAVFNEVHK
jgi:hypothetical protein